MNSVETKDRIERLFDKIKILTAMLVEDFSLTEFHDVMHMRTETVSHLKMEIEKERERLLEENTLYIFNRRIEKYLDEVKVMDTSVIAIIKNKMGDIQHELGSLSRKASVAMAYTLHKR